MDAVWVALASAVFAGWVAIAVSVAIERLGGVMGGIVGTLPTTIVPASIGMQANLSDDGAFADAMYITPGGMLLNVGFLYFWRVVPPRLPRWRSKVRLVAMTAISLGVWAMAALLLIQGTEKLRASSIPLMYWGVGITGVLGFAGILACLGRHSAPKGHRRVGVGTLMARGVLASCSIALSVWVASVGSALVAAVASVFPAIFLTTMVSLWLAQGEAVPEGAVGPMMLGSTSIAAYALVAALALPSIGPVLGTVVAWFTAASCVTVPATLWLHRARLEWTRIP